MTPRDNLHEAEEKRIRQVYAGRDASGKPDLYAWYKLDALFNQCRFRTVAVSLMSSQGIRDLSQLEVLDIGCGTGMWLRTLLEWGADDRRLHGIDLLEDRIHRAKVLCPGVDFHIASGYHIPFLSHSMDLISAHTVFSSIIRPDLRGTLAAEILRVLKPDGMILIYDYRISDPRNADTVGIRRAEVRRLFPNTSIQFRSLTLAPPISRIVAPVFPLLAHILESWFPFLRTHAFHLIRQRSLEN
jgi:ubiquinone/menaquinone biosynthesis C-methylase UbiE